MEQGGLAHLLQPAAVGSADPVPARRRSGRCWRLVLSIAWVGEALGHQRHRPGGDLADEMGGLEGLCRVVDVGQDDEHHDHGQDQGEAGREVGDHRRPVPAGRAHRPQHDQGVGEGGGHEADGRLGETVPQEPPHHPGRELAGGELDAEGGQGEDDAGDGDGGAGHRAQQLASAVDGEAQEAGHRFEGHLGVQGQHALGQSDGGDDEEGREEEEAVSEGLEERSQTHQHALATGAG
jgi:hypothetical protein